jgi:hypothetical protein
MDKYLETAEKIDLTGQDIINITKDQTNILLYCNLEKFNNIDEVFADKPTATILYQSKELGGHWICLIKHDNNTIEFFDPYGMDIDEELKYSEFNVRRHEGQLVPHLSHLLNSSNYNIIHNKYPLQKFSKNINTCGRHTSCRIRFRDMKLQHYIHLLTADKKRSPDMIVTSMTILYSM